MKQCHFLWLSVVWYYSNNHDNIEDYLGGVEDDIGELSLDENGEFDAATSEAYHFSTPPEEYFFIYFQPLLSFSILLTFS